MSTSSALPGTVEGNVPAFTPAPMNRPRQALLFAFVVVPQLIIFNMQKDYSAYQELAALFRPAFELQGWQRWLQTEKFLLVLACLSIERIVYTIVWLFPQHFVHFAQHSLLRHVGKGRPLDTILFLFWVSKIFQFGSIFGYYFSVGPLPAARDISLLRWVSGLQAFCLGQLLNAAIYRAIGKAGVYYGYKVGVPVPWCTGFPFDVFTMHPQYAGVCLSILGGGILMGTQLHTHEGFAAVGVSAALFYLYMSTVEDMPVEHPTDYKGPGSTRRIEEVRLRDLRKLKWSSFKSSEWYTTANILGFLARPWFSNLVAAAALANCFALVLPVNLLFAVFCVRSSYSVLPSASTVAGGVAIGVALLVWAVESSCPGPEAADKCRIVYLGWTAGDVRAHWPLTVKFATEHGLSGCSLMFGLQHPLPSVSAAVWHGHSAAPLILAAFVGWFVSLSLIGGLTVAVSRFLVWCYPRAFAGFVPQQHQKPKPKTVVSESVSVRQTPPRASKSTARARIENKENM
eukprot:CAMPEP_0119310546 /NCGR_PEP_ID=MMETSP1333-20130426/19628_1 /TAXON_ID=418940 /ORGANISM="Scyphosphaera apsteinii, Strain RCC1455" /LENGTH=513 /DNA_ID=CAMNT_0007314745 /DNA_START=21 /DNA_END=1562 /DNA_ORIENTATION=-